MKSATTIAIIGSRTKAQGALKTTRADLQHDEAGRHAEGRVDVGLEVEGVGLEGHRFLLARDLVKASRDEEVNDPGDDHHRYAQPDIVDALAGAQLLAASTTYYGRRREY